MSYPTDLKTLFFGYEVVAMWPDEMPHARLIDPASRHVTLAFLGRTSCAKLEHYLPLIPKPPFQFGSILYFNQCLLLPEKDPRVVAWHFTPFGARDEIAPYQRKLVAFLEGKGYALDKRPFLPHVTIGRAPFNSTEWREAFSPSLSYCTSFHLYESKGHSRYESLWSYPFHPPFKEIEHVADVAFCVYGKTLSEINAHAQAALGFTCPRLIPFLNRESEPRDLEEIMMGLNAIVTQGDLEMGIPFKAVSFHGNIEKIDGDILKWEMIVDV